VLFQSAAAAGGADDNDDNADSKAGLLNGIDHSSSVPVLENVINNVDGFNSSTTVTMMLPLRLLLW